MNLSIIPFLLVFLSLFFPIIAAYQSSLSITYLIDIITFLIFVYFCIVQKRIKIKSNLLIFIIFPIIINNIFMIIIGNGIGNKSVIGLLITTYIYYVFFEKSSENNKPKLIINQIKYIYIFLIGALILEAFLRLLGYDQMIFEPIASFNNEIDSGVKFYKFYNAAPLFKFIGFKEMTGLNSILLGSQIASQIVANCIIIFAPIYNKTRVKLLSDRNILFLISLICYPFVVTLTSNLILICIFLIVYFVIPNNKLSSNVSRVYSFIFLLIINPILLPLITFRISNINDLQIYYKSFIMPINSFLDFDIFSKLFGVGMKGLEFVDTGGDFGLGILLLNIGLVPTSFLLICFFILFRKTVVKLKLLNKLGLKQEPWSLLAAINILCATSWLISLVHYTQAFELGGRQIFSFHLAVALLAIDRMEKISKSYDYKLK